MARAISNFGFFGPKAEYFWSTSTTNELTLWNLGSVRPSPHDFTQLPLRLMVVWLPNFPPQFSKLYLKLHQLKFSISLPVVTQLFIRSSCCLQEPESMISIFCDLQSQGCCCGFWYFRKSDQLFIQARGLTQRYFPILGVLLMVLRTGPLVFVAWWSEYVHNRWRKQYSGLLESPILTSSFLKELLDTTCSFWHSSK